MVLTYHEAVEAGARALRIRAVADEARLEAWDEVPDAEWDEVLTVTHIVDGEVLCIDGPPGLVARVALTAVGYVDLKDEVDRMAAEALQEFDIATSYMTERDQVMRAGQAVARGATARIETLTCERDALAATLARVEALADDRRQHGSATGWHGQVHTVVKLADLCAALDPEANSQSGRDLEQPGSSVDVPYL